MAFSGENERVARTVAAIAANVWGAYDKDVKAALDAASPEQMLIQNEVCARAGVTAAAGASHVGPACATRGLGHTRQWCTRPARSSWPGWDATCWSFKGATTPSLAC